MNRVKNFSAGLFLGGIFPALVFSLDRFAGINPIILNKNNTLYILAIALDLIALRISYRRMQDDVIKGFTAAMFVSAVLIFNFRLLR